ncbi:hypothetical protein COO60DRAFT_1542173 [Scenedesmus sp. NREL 46B-D3]|nr:hypothetical protein COO60DRAFT_1542173 [Scenedesmus sp. NREL 46B-D3]
MTLRCGAAAARAGRPLLRRPRPAAAEALLLAIIILVVALAEYDWSNKVEASIQLREKRRKGINRLDVEAKMVQSIYT